LPEILFPSPSASRNTCKWNGRVFLIDDQEAPILAYNSLAYNTLASGWTDELTSFHESVAGDNHYIDVASRSHAIAALRARISQNEAVIIDIGCSSGSMLRALREVLPKATLIGADYISGPLLGLARSLPGIPFLQFNLVSCPLFSNSVDAVILLNVLEHIEEDFAAMQQAFRITRPGGTVIIEVPAGPHLFDVYDKQLMHFRRYTLDDLCEKLERAGFEIEERSYLGAFFYPAFAMVKKRNQRFMGCSDEIQRETVAKSISRARANPLMGAVMRVEEAVRPYVKFPFGIRCLTTCKKPG
jgi:ubiquinone/menaquinone biosynthesis C-methylase UbiE